MNHSHHGPTPIVEQLESRRLLAVNLTGDTLVIRGTPGDDNVVVRKKSTQLVVDLNGRKRRYTFDTVRRLTVNTRGGEDQIDLARAYRRSAVDSGHEDDRVIGSNRPDLIEADEGDDVIDGRDGNDTITGGGGRDTLYGGFGNDAIDGGTDRDRLLGEEGDDDLDANDDLWEDNLHGGPGFDHADIDDDLIVEDDTTSVEDEDD